MSKEIKNDYIKCTECGKLATLNFQRHWMLWNVIGCQYDTDSVMILHGHYSEDPDDNLHLCDKCAEKQFGNWSVTNYSKK